MLLKMIIGVAAILVLVVAVLAVVVALRPSEFRIQRTATMAAPPSAAFAQVNDFHTWEAWSPWAKLDPSAKNTFEGPSSGKGASFAWAGNNKVGEGRMTIVESRPDELIRIKLQFLKPFTATSTAEFAFRPEADRTAVTWSMYGHNNFVARAVCLFVDMDKALGAEFEKGLAGIKAAAEASAQARR